jgi:hypothetical protein
MNKEMVYEILREEKSRLTNRKRMTSPMKHGPETSIGKHPKWLSRNNHEE